jgi:hypothetical protein
LSATSISIAFVIEGQTVKLSDPNQWRAAIQNDDLVPATRVVAEEDGHRIYSGAASGFAPLAELFEDMPQGEAEPVVVEAVETTVPTTPVPVAETATPVDPAASAPTPTPPPQHTPPAQPRPVPRTATAAQAAAYRAGLRPQPEAPRKKASGLGCLLLLIVLGGLIFLIAQCTGDASRRPQVRYVEIATGVASRPDGPVDANLERGDSVTVLWPRTGQPQAWLEVKGGRFNGRYVREEALSSVRRPAIEATGRKRVVTTDNVRVRADPDGEPIDVANTGDQVQEIGVTSDGWSEITHGEGVAYIASRYTRAARR